MIGGGAAGDAAGGAAAGCCGSVLTGALWHAAAAAATRIESTKRRGKASKGYTITARRVRHLRALIAHVPRPRPFSPDRRRRHDGGAGPRMLADPAADHGS